PDAGGARSTYVPVAVSRIVFTDVTPSAGELVSEAVLDETATHAGQRFEGDVVVRDANGAAIVALRGARFQRVGADRPIEEAFHRIAWSAEKLTLKDAATAAGTWLVVGDTSDASRR